MNKSTTYRRIITPSNTLICVTLTLCGFNYVMFLFVIKSRMELCHFNGDQAGKSTNPHWRIINNDQAWVVEMAKYKSFDWEEELERLLQIIPVLEMRTDGTDSDTDPKRSLASSNNQSLWGQGSPKCKKLSLAYDRVQDEMIAAEIHNINGQYQNLYRHENGINSSVWDALKDKVFRNGLLLCKDLDILEKSRTEPRIKYSYRSFTEWKGKLQVGSDKTIPLKLRRFKRNTAPPPADEYQKKYTSIARSKQQPYLDKSFEHAKNELLSLLKTQGWYGTPRLLGVCLSTQNNEDVIESLMKGSSPSQLQPKELRYVVSRHDEAVTKLCDSYAVTDRCSRLYSVLKLVNTAKNPTLAALKLMINIATLFEQLQNSGAILYNLIGTDFLIDSNQDVMITDFSTMRFFTESIESQSHDIGANRPLSGTICKNNKQCAPASWQANTISYKFGFHCQETRGFCTATNRCWGIDSGVHACIFSRWLFNELRAAIPSGWVFEQNFTALIECAGSQSPEERCDWSYMKSVLIQLHKESRSTL